MKYRVFDIDYDIDVRPKELVEPILPKELIIDLDYDTKDLTGDLANAISNRTGWCVEGFNYEELPVKDDIDFEGIANYLIDYLCELYSPKETIALLSRAGCDEDQLVELGFEIMDIKQVLEEEEEEE